MGDTVDGYRWHMISLHWRCNPRLERAHAHTDVDSQCSMAMSYQVIMIWAVMFALTQEDRCPHMIEL